MIVDPAKINFTDLSGKERVGVINRNTKERVNSFVTISFTHSYCSLLRMTLQ